jgi:peptidoglycan/LPS O-acetylase OafA/YrhL
LEKETQKIWFLQLTRVFACLTIVYMHWFGILSTPNSIHDLFLQDPIPNYPTVNLIDYLQIITSYVGVNYFSCSYFGLGLFFILSGYVIPLSLKNSKPSDFLIRRIFRIYPTLIICLLITASTMTLVSLYLGSSEIRNVFKPDILLGNMLLIRDLLHVHHIENATWSLEVEMHFYLLFFFFFYFAIEKRIVTFIFSACLLLFLARVTFYLGLHLGENKKILGLAKLLVLNSTYISFMFVGTTLYYMLSKQWTYFKGIITIVFLLVLNYFCLNTGANYEGVASIVFLNHLYVLGFFLILYFMNDYIPYSKFLNKIAEISYPLYLTHGFTGYTLYFLFYHFTQNVTLSCVSALSAVATISLLVHYFIEKPGIALSKDIIKNKISFLHVPRYLLRKKSLESSLMDS